MRRSEAPAFQGHGRIPVSLRSRMPRIYINKVLNELRDELLSAMHSAVEREVRPGKPVDVSRLYRAFVRAATGKMANPVEISDRCMEVGKSSTTTDRDLERLKRDDAA